MKRNCRKLISGIIAAGAFTGILLTCDAPAVRADGLPLTVTIGTVTVTPGETGVVVAGDIVNTSSDVVDPDLASENVPFAASIDDSDFYNNTPYPFAPGQDTGMVDLFMFDVSPNATPGDYINDGTFDILQFDPNSPTDYDIVGEGVFTIDVVGATAPVPEPPSLLLLLAGIGAIALASCWRRQLTIPKPPSAIRCGLVPFGRRAERAMRAYKLRSRVHCSVHC